MRNIAYLHVRCWMNPGQWPSAQRRQADELRGSAAGAMRCISSSTRFVVVVSKIIERPVNYGMNEIGNNKERIRAKNLSQNYSTHFVHSTTLGNCALRRLVSLIRLTNVRISFGYRKSSAEVYHEVRRLRQRGWKMKMERNADPRGESRLVVSIKGEWTR